MEASPAKQLISPAYSELSSQPEDRTWLRWALYGTAVTAGVTACWFLYRATVRYRSWLFLPVGTQVFIANTEQQCDELLEKYFAKEKIVGFDIEWKPNSGSNASKTALIQLASEKHVLLIRTCKLLDGIPKSLAKLLADPTILKAGVAILSDARMLWSDFGVVTAGCVDLQSLAHKYGHTEGGSSLAALSLRLLGKKLNKSHHIRCSNWERDELSYAQINYAALDAWAGHQIFCKLFLHHNPEKLALEKWVEGLVDTKPAAVITKPKSKNSFPQPAKVPKVPKLETRKKDLYENCRMLSPDGTLLSICDRKKVAWYLERNIAEVVCEDPLTIKLKFTPSGRGKAEDPYYLADKQNRCVACGVTEKLCKHCVVPHCYRACFDDKLKNRNSFDILLLCTDCTRRCVLFDTQRQTLIASTFNAPLNGIGEKYLINEELEKVKSAARALIRDSKKLPSNRIQQLSEIVKTYLKKTEFTTEELQQILKLDTRTENAAHKSHGQLVVEQLKTEEQLVKFIRGWRQHFLDSMKPKYLPMYWTVDHTIWE